MASTRGQFKYLTDAEGVTVQKVRMEIQGEDEVKVVEREERFNLADVPTELQNGEGLITLAAYGLSQKLQDSVSSLTADEKLDGMLKAFESLVSGMFKQKRASTGGGVKKAQIDPFFAKAFAEMLSEKSGKDVSPEAAVAMLQARSTDERKAFRSLVADRINELKREAEESASGMGDLLDSLI